MLMLDPNLVIFDEFEQDVEPEELEIIASHIKDFLKNKGKSVIVVTQSKEFLDLLKPTNFNILVDGNIKAQGSEELYKRIVDHGYSQFS
jgi:Fe-S cluster assembly ATPase SufC